MEDLRMVSLMTDYFYSPRLFSSVFFHQWSIFKNKRREWLCPCFFLKILRRTEEYRGGVLTRAADHVQEWSSKVKKMKAIYYTLNLCNIDITQKLIVAEIWCPVSDLTLVQNALIMGSVCMFIHCLEESFCRPPSLIIQNYLKVCKVKWVLKLMLVWAILPLCKKFKR